MNNATTGVPQTTSATITVPPTTPPYNPLRWKENADFVARYKDLFDRKISPPPALSTPVPDDVVARLVPYKLQWNSLNAFAQRALVWDSGYVRADDGATTIPTWIKVYTVCPSNRTLPAASMGTIALKASDIRDGDLSTCTNAASNTYYRLPASTLSNVTTTVKCAVESFSAATLSGASTWSQDGLPSTAVPQLTAQLHELHAMAIHASPTQEPDAEACPTSNGALIVPCATYTADSTAWCRPAPSNAMTAWLTDLQTLASRTRAPTPAPSIVSPPSNIDDGDNALSLNGQPINKSRDYAIICVGLAFGLAAVVVGVCFMRWFHRKLQSMLEGNYVPVSTPTQQASQRHLDRREL
ncbi:Aste57867_20340 [Aphanomyces stellatus]|uniref:Aste57867_20340 protein n=1 Tax=Aphanomyces stellatus TaxID=120398 RepID=A0A485LEP9_9STRA|nr:hypothetical protein As57867_020274 [Aphanomyces stellatus]VFT97027.1 Aste57867_20340 [Aphanomyces stellatus]